MRIIAGSARGRRLRVPGGRRDGPLLRPTSDRAREALFSIIGAFVMDAVVLDLYAGTGALGLEAMSRGAGTALFVDHDAAVLKELAANIAACGFSSRATVIRRDLTRGLAFAGGDRPEPFSLVFLDPPYGTGLAARTLRDLATADLLTDDALVVVEEQATASLPERIGELVLFRQRRYGDSGFWFYAQEGQGRHV